MSERPAAVMRLFPEHGTRYVRVYVWATRRAMCARLRATHCKCDASVQGSCVSFTAQRFVRGRWRTMPHFAEVNLYRQRLGMEIVTHELFHATMAYGRRVRLNFGRLNAPDSVNADEERLTYAHGRMCAQFVNHAERLGLYDPSRWEPTRRAA